MLSGRSPHPPLEQRARLRVLGCAAVLVTIGLLETWTAGVPSGWAAQSAAGAAPFQLGEPTTIAEGVLFYRPAAASLLDPPGPVAVQALRVDPAKAPLRIALADDQTPARQPVAAIAAVRGATAAINASFFDARGRQVGLLKADGEIIAVGRQPRGAIGWNESAFVFDRVRARVSLRIGSARPTGVAIDHVNPAASRAGLSLYTSSFRLPIYGRRSPPPAPTPPPPAGAPTIPASEDEKESGKTPRWARVYRWVLSGDPQRVVRVVRDGDEELRLTSAVPHGQPADGRAILVFRSTRKSVPTALRGLTRDIQVDLVQSYETLEGSQPATWQQARFAVAGAGLLAKDGRAVADWNVEGLREVFVAARHPRTLIGRDADGGIWLVTVDGRRPETSVGMSFAELQRLAGALKLVDALNLDGGGSTTMVVRGEIVNRPTDLVGPRPVPDAIVVLARDSSSPAP